MVTLYPTAREQWDLVTVLSVSSIRFNKKKLIDKKQYAFEAIYIKTLLLCFIKILEIFKGHC